eukprot:611033-Pyramimonas_sp.AAC.2
MSATREIYPDALLADIWSMVVSESPTLGARLCARLGSRLTQELMTPIQRVCSACAFKGCILRSGGVLRSIGHSTTSDGTE